jgi:pyruvate oxidase
MTKLRCTVCNYIYDEEKEGIKFDDLPSDWVCPICSAPKSAFVPLGEVRVEETGAPTVADKIVEQLTALGVKYVFGMPGDSILPLVDSLSRQDNIKFILTRHESTGAFMASAYGKLTGELSCCLSIAGPGATNMITGLVDAATDRSPVIALLGQVAQVFLGSEYLQEIDEIDIFSPFSVFAETLSKPAQTLNLMMIAAKKALLNQGASILSLPTDVLAETLKDEIWDPDEHIFPQKIAPSEEEVKKVAKIIDVSRRPLVFGGWGIRNCGEDVIKFADKLSAPIATTSRAKGVIPETHDLAVGVLGSIGSRYAAKAVSKADLVIVIGSGFRQRNLLPNIPIVQIDIDGTRLGRSFPVEAGLIGDAGVAVRMLLEHVVEKKPDEMYLNEIRELKRAYLEELEEEAQDISIPINPGYVIQAIKRHANKDAIITVDSGDHTYWFYKKYVCDGERTLMSANMASIGFAFPASLAAQLAYPERQVICVNGDGGFGQLMADFTTAVREELPVKVVLFNDNKIKNIAKEQLMYGYPVFGISFPNPNFAEFARTCGGEGYRCETPAQLEDALDKAFISDKPALIDILVDPEKMAPGTKSAE